MLHIGFNVDMHVYGAMGNSGVKLKKEDRVGL